jgi:two-component system response regulator FixJ
MGDSRSDAAPKAAGDVRILDDDEAVLRYLTHVVQSLGYRVQPFQDPAAFLSNAAAQPPACVVVDWQLAGRDGLEVIAQCQQQWPGTPAILLSGHVTVPVTVAAMRQGVAGVLQKPVRPEELGREMAAAVARSQSRTSAAEERAKARRQVQELSELELSILKLLVEGTPNKNIATQTGLAIRTVEKYRRIVFDKLGVDSAAESTRIWVLATIDE